MAAIKGKDTKPEIAVRSLLDALKVKYELHQGGLPGKPDIVLPRRKKIIFVHGCFWHVHRCRYGRVKPVEPGVLGDKRDKTKLRDRRTGLPLRKNGWNVFTVWGCWTGKSPVRLTSGGLSQSVNQSLSFSQVLNHPLSSCLMAVVVNSVLRCTRTWLLWLDNTAASLHMSQADHRRRLRCLQN